MKKMIYAILGLVITTSCFAANKHFDTMVVFGDSLSDNGNLYHYMWNKLPVSPPYFDGRFSNGLVWIEQLHRSYYPEAYLQGLQNYAVGGAGAVLSYKLRFPFTLAIELNNYFYWNTYGKKDSTLYTVWIGANNYLNGPTNINDITDSVIGAIGAIGDTVEQLIADGGNNFFIPNMPDLGLVPQAVDWHLQPLLTELTDVHNVKLAAKVNQLKLKYPEVTIVYFDIHSFFTHAMDHASDYGFSNTTDPCYMGSYSGWLGNKKLTDRNLAAFLKQKDLRINEKRWEMINNNPALKEAAAASYIYQLLPDDKKAEQINCEQYVFWDRVHPTDRTHHLIAQKAREALDEAGLEAFASVS